LHFDFNPAVLAPHKLSLHLVAAVPVHLDGRGYAYRLLRPVGKIFINVVHNGGTRYGFGRVIACAVTEEKKKENEKICISLSGRRVFDIAGICVSEISVYHKNH
jgi:uncharacterized protein (DUF934 family)